MLHALRETFRALFGTEQKLTEFQRLVKDTVVQRTDAWSIQMDTNHDVTMSHTAMRLTVRLTKIPRHTMLGDVMTYAATVEKEMGLPKVNIDGDAAREMFEVAEQEFYHRREDIIDSWTAEAAAKLKSIDEGSNTQ